MCVRVSPGHCSKTIAIVRTFHALSETTPLKWLMVADDDTLLRYRVISPHVYKYC